MPAVRAPLSHRDFLKIDKNYEAAASAAHLIYVNDKDPGITRLKKGKGFVYFFKDERVKDPGELERIRKLVIPPAWTSVWICRSANGHIQATGYDVSGRKQYRYHPRWSALQQETKFHRLYEFGKALPCIREQLEKDLSQPGFPEPKVLAMVVSLMERTYIRVGSNDYEKRYGSYGLTTLKNKHVNVQGNTITFSFKGKKGVYHKITLKSKRFARIIKQCKAIPGSELFQYYDDSGTLHKVDSSQVNDYLKNCSGQDFTTKDFRTWAGSLMMLRLLKDCPPCETAGELQKNIVEGFKAVSKSLGNTVAVCKKYYVHPELITLYQARELEKYDSATDDEKEKLNADERILMNVLRAVQREKFQPNLTGKLLKASIRKQKKALAA